MKRLIVNVRAILSGVILVAAVSACGDEEVTITQVVTPKPPEKITPVSTDDHLVYIALNESIESIWVPKLITPDGTVTTLTDGKRAGQTTALAVDSQKNTYVAGWHNTSKGNDYALYWKNTVPVLLTDTVNDASSSASDIVVIGEDVYVSGYVGGQAVYWKNGVRVNLSDGASFVVVYGMFVSGNDVYVTGATKKNFMDNYEACYWKNGSQIKLPATLKEGSAATGILVVGDDLYITGAFGKGKYWKNGSLLTLEATEGNTGDILLSNGSVYITGVGRYWKDSVPVNMMSETSRPNIFCIAVLDDLVYLGGFQSMNSFNTSIIWKDGKPIILSDGKHHGAVSDIAVVRK